MSLQCLNKLKRDGYVYLDDIFLHYIFKEREMKKYLLTILFALTAGGVSSSYAAMMQTIWTATVSDAQSTAAPDLFTNGEVFTAIAIYDDAVRRFTRYGDGPNGIAEFGSGDDTINNTTNLSSSYTYTDNVEFVLSSNFYTLFNNFSDTTVENEAWQQLYSGGTRFQYKADGFLFEFKDNFLGETGIVFIELINYQSYKGIATFSDVTMTTSVYTPPVPVPAAVWLFSSGLIGLVGYAKRKKT